MCGGRPGDWATLRVQFDFSFMSHVKKELTEHKPIDSIVSHLVGEATLSITFAFFKVVWALLVYPGRIYFTVGFKLTSPKMNSDT